MANVHYLISTAGYPNFGDEEIVRTWLAFFRKYDPTSRVILDVPFASRAGLLFHHEFADLQIVDTTWNMVDFLTVTNVGLTDFKRHREILTGDDPRNTLGIRLLTGADTIHLLGGGYFDVTNPDFKRSYHFFPLLGAVKALNADVHLFASGLGLTPIDEETVAALATYTGDFDRVGVRDDASLVVAGTVLEPDDVFMSSNLGSLALNQRDDNPEILLSVQPIDQASRAGLVDQLLAFLRLPDNAAKEIAVIEAMVPDDNWLYFSRALDEAPDVKDRMRFYSFWEVWQRGLPVRPGQVWVTTRFHLHLVGALLGYKGTAISVGSDYYNTKHQSLLTVGTGWQYFDEPALGQAIAPMAVADGEAKLRAVGQWKLDMMRELYGF
jgi:hypothetical protein